MGRKCSLVALVAVICLAIAPAVRGELRDLNTRHYRIHTDLEEGLVRCMGKGARQLCRSRKKSELVCPAKEQVTMRRAIRREELTVDV